VVRMFNWITGINAAYEKALASNKTVKKTPEILVAVLSGGAEPLWLMTSMLRVQLD